MNAYLIALAAFSIGYIAGLIFACRIIQAHLQKPIRKSKQELVQVPYKVETGSQYHPIPRTCSSCLCDFWASQDWTGEECAECSKVAHI